MATTFNIFTDIVCVVCGGGKRRRRILVEDFGGRVRGRNDTTSTNIACSKNEGQNMSPFDLGYSDLLESGVGCYREVVRVRVCRRKDEPKFGRT